MDYLKLTQSMIIVEEIIKLVQFDKCTEILQFTETPRSTFHRKQVLSVEYKTLNEETALNALKNICADVRLRWPTVRNIAIYHRMGPVSIKEISLMIAISGLFRLDTINALIDCIEEIKVNVPITKEYIPKRNPLEHNIPGMRVQQLDWMELSDTDSNSEFSDMDSNSELPDDECVLQANVTPSEMDRRLNIFIERKREQMNFRGLKDFMPSMSEEDTLNPQNLDTCARVCAVYDRKRRTKEYKVQMLRKYFGLESFHMTEMAKPEQHATDASVPSVVAGRVENLEKSLLIKPVNPNIYSRLKQLEDKVARLESVSLEYHDFWNRSKRENVPHVRYNSNSIRKKIDMIDEYILLHDDDTLI